MGEDELVIRAARGDEAAFRTIWHRHRDAVYRFAAWMLREPSAAEDVTQDTFLALLQEPGRYNAQTGSLRTFLFAIARNVCRNKLRKLRPEEDLEFDGQSPGSDSLSSLLAAESDEALRSAIALLPALQREVLFLFEFEELSLVDVATVLQVDPNAVKGRLHRARQRLRKDLSWMKT